MVFRFLDILLCSIVLTFKRGKCWGCGYLAWNLDTENQVLWVNAYNDVRHGMDNG